MESFAAIKTALLQLFTDDPVNWVKWGVVFLVLIGGYAIAIPLYARLRYRLGWERKREIALRRGHVIPAVLTKSYRGEREGNTRMWHAVYTYHREGREKEFRALFKNSPPPGQRELYYLKNPRRLFCMGEYHWESLKGLLMFPVVILPWLLAAGTLLLLRLPLPASGL